MPSKRREELRPWDLPFQLTFNVTSPRLLHNKTPLPHYRHLKVISRLSRWTTDEPARHVREQAVFKVEERLPSFVHIRYGIDCNF